MQIVNQRAGRSLAISLPRLAFNGIDTVFQFLGADFGRGVAENELVEALGCGERWSLPVMPPTERPQK
jgi:hypothetical protein